jgi:hypothetical protein
MQLDVFLVGTCRCRFLDFQASLNRRRRLQRPWRLNSLSVQNLIVAATATAAAIVSWSGRDRCTLLLGGILVDRLIGLRWWCWGW